MKNILLLLLIFGILTTATATATTATARAECPSDDADFCSQYNLAQQGDAEAQLTLGWMYYDGEGVAEDIEAVRWWRKAAEQGLVGAQYNLGVMYGNGEGVITDEREAYIWFSIAKANGVKKAADILRKIKRDLTTAEIKSARGESARRLEAIEQTMK